MLNPLAGIGPGPKAGGRETGGLALPEKRRVPLWMMAGFWVSITISVAVVLRRLVAMARPSHLGPRQMLALDRAFASRSALTLAHIVPALLFVLLLPFVFIRRASATFAERLLFPLGAVVGITAYLMSADAIGGWVERSAVLLFNSLYLFSLAKAYGYMRRGNYVQQRRWMVRAVAVLLGIATTRPVMGVFFATSGLTHLEPRQFFGIAFWIGFSTNTIAVELWLHSRQRFCVASQERPICDEHQPGCEKEQLRDSHLSKMLPR